MAAHAQLKFVMTECSKTQIRLTGLNWENKMAQNRLQNVVGIIAVSRFAHNTTLRLLMLVENLTMGLTYTDEKPGTGTRETLHWTYS